GVVRDHDSGRGVERLEYTAHPGAGDVIAEVAREIAARYPDSIVAVTHRYGPLDIGGSALACAVSAPHRKQAFAACDGLAETATRRCRRLSRAPRPVGPSASCLWRPPPGPPARRAATTAASPPPTPCSACWPASRPCRRSTPSSTPGTRRRTATPGATSSSTRS